MRHLSFLLVFLNYLITMYAKSTNGFSRANYQEPQQCKQPLKLDWQRTFLESGSFYCTRYSKDYFPLCKSICNFSKVTFSRLKQILNNRICVLVVYSALEVKNTWRVLHKRSKSTVLITHLSCSNIFQNQQFVAFSNLSSSKE